MKYLIPIVIALCLLLLLGYTHDLGEEVSDLKERQSIHKQEIKALKGQIATIEKKSEYVIAEVRKIVTPLKKLIPIHGGHLGLMEDYDVEEINANKD